MNAETRDKTTFLHKPYGSWTLISRRHESLINDPVHFPHNKYITNESWTTNPIRKNLSEKLIVFILHFKYNLSSWIFLANYYESLAKNSIHTPLDWASCCSHLVLTHSAVPTLRPQNDVSSETVNSGQQCGDITKERFARKKIVAVCWWRKLYRFQLILD